MFSLKLISSNLMEKKYNNMGKVLANGVSPAEIKRGILASQKFLIGDELMITADLLNSINENTQTISSECSSILSSLKNEYMKTEKHWRTRVQIWKEFASNMPFNEITLERPDSLLLVQKQPNGSIAIRHVSSTGRILSVTFVIEPNELDENTSWFNMVKLEMSAALKATILENLDKDSFETAQILGMFAAIQVYEILTYINCRNIKTVKYSAKKSETGKLPKVLQSKFEYTIVKILGDVTQYSSLEEVKIDMQKPASSEMKLHVVRGHFKRRSSGVFWWNSFLRGHRKNGVIEKHYEVG